MNATAIKLDEHMDPKSETSTRPQLALATAAPATPAIGRPMLAWTNSLFRLAVPPILGLALFIGIWALVAQNTPTLPGPVKTWVSAVELFSDPFYQKGPNDQGIGWNILASLERVPWLTCYDNVYLAVERVFARTEGSASMKKRTQEALALVGLTHAEHKYPHEISGGMKQRVGIARALSMEPKVLLMDEPFGALDALTRAHLQDELMKIAAETKSTVVMVTHDVDEAVLLSDRIVMMTNGPAATIGEILSVNLPRPRERLAIANHPKYHEYRGAVLDFLYRRQLRQAA